MGFPSEGAEKSHITPGGAQGANKRRSLKTTTATRVAIRSCLLLTAASPQKR